MFSIEYTYVKYLTVIYILRYTGKETFIVDKQLRGFRWELSSRVATKRTV